jgi:hypothetical protein
MTSSLRNRSWLAFLLLVTSLAPGAALAQFGGGATVYKDPDFNGQSASIRDDEPDLRGYGLNDEISSIRIPRGQAWEICQDVGYGNRCQVITASIADLKSIGWDDRISSMRRARVGGSRGPGTTRVFTVFTNANFEGESASFRNDEPDLQGYGLNDQISSILVPPGESWEICQDVQYGNRCQVVTRSISDLRSIGWDNRISSLRRTGNGGYGRGPRGGNPGVGDRESVTVFKNTNFRGESASFREAVPDLVPYDLNDEISSIQIPPGQTWEVCQDSKFGNRCQTISRSISDLGSIGWDDRISSLRRVQ